jgi:hypothetical protein
MSGTKSVVPIAAKYTEGLKDLVVTPVEVAGFKHVYHSVCDSNCIP